MASRCGRKILGIFGGLLIIAILFVPYRETHIVYSPGPSRLLARRVTTEQRGYILLTRFLKTRGRWVSEKTKEERLRTLNKTMFAAEIGGIFIVGAFDYLLFCLWLGRKKRQHENI